MKKIFYILIPVILLGYFAVSASLPHADQQKQENNNEILLNPSLRDKALNSHPENVKLSFKCKSCHVSEYPTEKDPGLLDCPRNNIVSVYHSPKEGPEVVDISEMSDKYSGVIFSHRVHAEMSEMTEGCSGCHHFNTTGPILNCRNCHSANRNREDVSIPDLKAAYHRQCMKCHKQWSNENGCNTQCHLSKGADKNQKIAEIKTKTHPEITKPTKITWETSSKINKTVAFNHDEHVQLFRIECRNCHNEDNCIKCHMVRPRAENNKPVKIEKSIEEHHKPCISCHNGNSCRKCHNENEYTSFDHYRSSGWQLQSYHSGLTCAKCHGSSVPYRSPDNNCVSCHKNFTTVFDHKLKGFTFSEAHKEIECAGCHAKGDFKSPPICTDCHDDKAFPADLPGKK